MEKDMSDFKIESMKVVATYHDWHVEINQHSLNQYHWVISKDIDVYQGVSKSFPNAKIGAANKILSLA